MNAEAKKAVVLLSGGLDSAVCAALAKSDGFSLYALTFSYGQRHRVEVEAAKRVAEQIGALEHRILSIDLGALGGSALTTSESVSKRKNLAEIGGDIPSTYVPARNTIFLSFALAYAEVVAASEIFIGVNSIDYSGYPDCRPEYIAAFQGVADLATRATVGGERRININTPLIKLTKAEIIKLGASLGVDFSLTHSCYDPSPAGKPCGECDSCLLRKDGFKKAGIEDPLDYGAVAFK
ncbi:MAG: 7-cyano-7-deazaguanine synthase QueC [Myxococcota bacterium]